MALKYKILTIKFENFQIASLYIRNMVIFKLLAFNEISLFIYFNFWNWLQSCPAITKLYFFLNCQYIGTHSPMKSVNGKCSQNNLLNFFLSVLYSLISIVFMIWEINPSWNRFLHIKSFLYCKNLFNLGFKSLIMKTM